MIIIRMAAGLANRMFQYAYYLYLKQMGLNVHIDNSYRRSIGHTDFAHEHIDWKRVFPKAKYSSPQNITVYKYGGGQDLFSKIRRRFLPFTTNVSNLTNPFIYKDVNELRKNEYIIGVFQNAKMASNIRTQLIELFSFPEIKDSKNKNLVNEIQSCESVAIHIRKGNDYSRLDRYNNTCEIDYYMKAINTLKNKIDNPRYYIFTDNPQWVKDNFNFVDYKIIDWNPTVGWGNHLDMQLMSLCKHNIIANSTYSWWGAFLNTNPNRIVIAPHKWFNEMHPQLGRLENLSICDNWIAL